MERTEILRLWKWVLLLRLLQHFGLRWKSSPIDSLVLRFRTILAVLSQGAVVQVENSDEEIGPALPGEETRRPTEEALLQVMQKKREASEKSEDGKKLERCEWMTMLPDSAISSAFAATRPRRFANLPAGCTMDPSWTETAEERARREREYLAKHVIGGVCVNEKEPAMTKERERELDAYFEQLDRERESLSQIYQRVGRSCASFLVDTE